jgi:hypothetical protein
MKNELVTTLAGRLKGMFTKVVVAGVLAGAGLFAAPKQTAAQGFSVQFGVAHPYARPYYGPVYVPPAYGPGFYAERRHEEWLQHERWDREHSFRGPFTGRPPAYGYYGR